MSAAHPPQLAERRPATRGLTEEGGLDRERRLAARAFDGGARRGRPRPNPMPRKRTHATRISLVDEPAAPATWKQLVCYALAKLGGSAALRDLYKVIEQRPETRTREHWQAKVRQVLQASAEFVRVSPGVWSFVSLHPPEELERLEALRRARYPRRTEAKS